MTTRATISLLITGPLQRLAIAREGATAVEYALIASGVGAVIAATVWGLGTALNGFYTSVAALF
jgi:Flp pilus assembly pilin Flp